LFDLLFVCVLVKNASLVGVSIIDTKYTMPPTGLDDAVPLPEEDLLGLKLIEILELRLNLLEFLAAIPWDSDLARVNHELSLSFLQIGHLLVNLLEMVLSLGLVIQRLFLGQLLQSGDSISLLQR
jgi:hypothetical protein